LAGLVRERLAGFGLVGPAEITLADGNRAGRGDLVRARLNTKIDADGQTLANRDTIRIEGLAGTGPGHLAVVSRQTGPGGWSKRFFVPAAYLQESAELAYAGNVHVAQGRTVDTGHLVVDAGASRSLVYTGATRGRERNTIHVSTGAPDPAQPSRGRAGGLHPRPPSSRPPSCAVRATSPGPGRCGCGCRTGPATVSSPRGKRC